jgi:tetratricopeptide (TPR) repeat protein
MPATPKLLGGRYQFIQTLNTHEAGKTLLAADTHYPGHPKCVVRQLRLPTRNPMTRKFILSLLKKKVEVLEVIGQHEQVPSTFAAFDTKNSFYIVQEFIPGRSLQEEIVANHPWSQTDVLYLLKEVLPVMAFAQDHGVVHGNLKPSKLIRHQEHNRLIVLDFGSIKTISKHVSSKSTDQGSESSPEPHPLYLAPEQFRRQSLFCSDHYALGMLAIQALTGLPAEKLPSGQDADLHQEIIALLESIPRLGTNTASLLARMVHPNPQQRYQKAVDILSDLERLDGLGPPASHMVVESALHPIEDNGVDVDNQPTRKFPHAVLGVTGALLLALVALGVLLKWPQRWMARQHIQQGAALQAADNPEAAIAQYTQAIKLVPNHSEALVERGQLYFETGDTEAALTDITKAIEKTPTNATYLYHRANVRFGMGDVQGAIEDYTEAIANDSQFVKAYVNRGSARAAWGDDAGAIEDYTQAIALTGPPETEAAAYLNRCLSHSNLGDQVLALEDCTQAINLRPSHGLAYQNRGLVRRRLGDFQGSLRDYNIAIQIDPDTPDPYYNRALTRQAMDDLPGTMQDLTKAIAIDPDHVLAIYDRGLLQADLGNITAALADLRTASQLCLDLGRTGCYEDAQYHISQLQSASATPANQESAAASTAPENEAPADPEN